MSSEKNSGISPFQRYLSLWVFLCMVAGVLVGHFLPSVPRFLDRLQIDGISIPIAILIWIMIYPMMMKVDFQSIREVGRHPKGLFVTWITNWLIKPFTMYALAAFFFFHVFQAFIPQDLATQYLAGAVLLGAAPCTAMVFVWSTLTKGDPAYTVVQVATNDLIILAAFVPIVKFLLGVSHVTVPYSVLFLSIFLILLIAIPLVLQTYLIFAIAYGASNLLHLPHNIAAPAGMIGASNFFELAVAVAIALFGVTSPAALATTVGVLTEVPVMLSLVKIANK